MNVRELYRETILFKNPDKIPLALGGPRESTIKAWRKQGLPEGVLYTDVIADILGISKKAFLRRDGINVSFKMIPEFEQIILEHKNGHYIIRDWMGAITEISDQYDESYLCMAKDFVTRKWHKFPIETREDWKEMKSRFNPDTPERFAKDFQINCKSWKDRENAIMLTFNGIFWQLREWCGFENLCIFMAEDPNLIHEMADFWSEFVTSMLKKTLPHIAPDCVMINEDMAYKAHSMISPHMTREFIQSAYKKWIPLIKNDGCPIIELDSDGCVDVLIPIWIESGINCCSPIEVAAYCDILDYRKKYGKNMAFMQGIDKRIIAKGGRELEEHVMKIVPAMFKEGGYIPGCDHGVPPDISWQNFIEFSRLIAKLSGWL